MRYFVSGGAGFIGSHVVDRLCENGDVTVYDNLSSGRKEFISSHIGRPGFRFVEADLLDFPALKRSMADHDVVFHLAANPEARQGIEKTDLDLRVGTLATYNVLEAMRLNGVGKLVFSSSGTVYGETPARPVNERYGPLLPISLYGASKLACEGLVSAYSHVFAVQAWILRFANVVGRRATHGVIYDFITRLRWNPRELEILGDGTQEKPYLLVDDCVDGVVFAMRESHQPLNVFNLGVSTSTSVTKIARMVVEEMGLDGVRFVYSGGDRGWPGDVPQIRYDVSGLNKLGWRARYSSDEAVRFATRQMLSASPRVET